MAGLESLNVDGEDQYMPGQKRDVTYVSRLQVSINTCFTYMHKYKRPEDTIHITMQTIIKAQYSTTAKTNYIQLVSIHMT